MQCIVTKTKNVPLKRNRLQMLWQIMKNQPIFLINSQSSVWWDDQFHLKLRPKATHPGFKNANFIRFQLSLANILDVNILCVPQILAKLWAGTWQTNKQTDRQIWCKKVKVKSQYICIAYCRQPTYKELRYGNTLSRDLTVLPAHPRIYPWMEWAIPAFAFPAKASTHLPTPKEWTAELAWATRMVSKQSAQDCYEMFIATADQSKHHASLGK